MSPKNTKFKRNKRTFYVGADHILPHDQMCDKGSQYVTTLDEAIKAATKKARDTKKAQIVVQIVRIVEPMPTPVRIKVV